MTPSPTLSPPARLALRPRDKHGRIVPAFVAHINGQPDHRIARPDAVRRAYDERLCYLCNFPLGVYGTFILGPMCVINGISPEPPSHRTCAEYAAQACPFLTNPGMRRREHQPEGTVEPGGIMERRNPGVIALYVTEQWSRTREKLFSVRIPHEVTWWREGRPAAYADALDSLLTGLEVLRAQADKDDDPDRSHELLTTQHERALSLLPGNLK